MKNFDKTLDRIMGSRSHSGRLIWNSGARGTYNVGNNATKRKIRAADKERRRAQVAAREAAQ